MAAGDSDAIARFYNDFFDAMFREARRACGRDEQFCLDIVQEAMLKVIRSIRPMETQAQLVQWTRRLVRNAAFDQLRAEIRRKQREVRSASPTAVEGQAREIEELSSQMNWLAAELDSMPASESRLLSARYEWGWTLQRIGRELGISAGAVDGRIRRLLARIRHRYGKRSDDE